MALLADRILYRLSAVWWTAIYGGLRGAGDRSSAAATNAPVIETSMIAEAGVAVAA